MDKVEMVLETFPCFAAHRGFSEQKAVGTPIQINRFHGHSFQEFQSSIEYENIFCDLLNFHFISSILVIQFMIINCSVLAFTVLFVTWSTLFLCNCSSLACFC